MNVLWSYHDVVSHILSYCDQLDKHRLYNSCLLFQKSTKSSRYSFNIKLAIELMELEYIDIFTRDSGSNYFIYRYIKKLLKTQNHNFLIKVFIRYPNYEYLNSLDFFDLLFNKFEDWEKVLLGLYESQIILELSNIVFWARKKAKYIFPKDEYFYLFFTNGTLLWLLLENRIDKITDIIDLLRHVLSLIDSLEYIKKIHSSKPLEFYTETDIEAFKECSLVGNSIDVVKWRVEHEYYMPNDLLEYVVTNNCFDDFYPRSKCFIDIPDYGITEIYPGTNSNFKITDKIISDLGIVDEDKVDMDYIREFYFTSSKIFKFDMDIIICLAKNNNFEAIQPLFCYDTFVKRKLIKYSLKHDRLDITKQILNGTDENICSTWMISTMIDLKNKDNELSEIASKINQNEVGVYCKDLNIITKLNISNGLKYLYDSQEIEVEHLVQLCDNNNIQLVVNLISDSRASHNIRKSIKWRVCDSSQDCKFKKILRKIASNTKYKCLINFILLKINQCIFHYQELSFYIIKYSTVENLKMINKSLLNSFNSFSMCINTALKHQSLEAVEYLLSNGFKLNKNSLYYAFMNGKDTAIWVLNRILNENRVHGSNVIELDKKSIINNSNSLVKPHYIKQGGDVLQQNFIKWVNETTFSLD